MGMSHMPMSRTSRFSGIPSLSEIMSEPVPAVAIMRKAAPMAHTIKRTLASPLAYSVDNLADLVYGFLESYTRRAPDDSINRGQQFANSNGQV